ncbi:MAG: DNA primase [Alphaproteobacteria bacterium MarineAlpha9_Bin3]|nr:MAG: DNA primase [Alphaproteobacteria bacterium MarineAlpha9_Bin3]|tara:strand:- start:1011 stop:2729 length:1719 start_codon:yes stop_codon:yes gene_type:complete
MAFSDNLVNTIHDKIILSEYIGRTVNLSKKGNDFIGLCPFHNEKTPSFTVSNDKGFYHCFGCGAHGDIISFVMQKESIDFKETLQILASEIGVNIENYSLKDKKISEDEKNFKNIYEFSKVFFNNNFNNESANQVKIYLKNRKISSEASKYFELGYIKNNPDNLISFLESKGFSINKIIESGLARKSKKNDKYYDFFRNRLIFPIHNSKGEVVAFGGRSLNSSEPKYLNSPDTILFKKRKLLFNFHRAKKYVQKHKIPFIVVEGYMDVIALYHIGLYGAVAPLGTALSEEQLLLLWKISDEPIICMDGDQAGYRSAIRTLNIAMKILKPGKSLKFTFLSDGDDPDNLVFKSEKQKLIDMIKNASPMFNVFWDSETVNLDLTTPEKRAAFRLNMEKKISLIEDSIVQKEYKKSFYSNYNSLFPNNYSNYKKTNFKTNNNEIDKLPAGRIKNNSSANLREKNLIETIFNNPSILTKVEEEFAILAFSNKKIETLRLAILSIYKQSGELTDLNISEIKKDSKYDSIIEEIFKSRDWAASRFIPDYVKKNEDLNYVIDCWKDAANLQKKWYKKENI